MDWDKHKTRGKQIKTRDIVSPRSSLYNCHQSSRPMIATDETFARPLQSIRSFASGDRHHSRFTDAQHGPSLRTNSRGEESNQSFYKH